MGPFERLAIQWTPAIEYRDYPANEVEDIAWESTITGSRRGFLIGFSAGALLIALIIAGVVTAGLYPFPAPATAPRQEGVASQDLTRELNTLREENQALKTQVTATKAAATCPPCQPQTAEKNQPRERTAAPPPQPSQSLTTKAAPQRKVSDAAPDAAPPREPSKQGATSATPQRKVSSTVPDEDLALPIPSNCRKPGDCR